MANYGPSDEGFFEGSVSGSLSSLDSWEGDSLPDLEEDPVGPDEGVGYMIDEWEDALGIDILAEWLDEGDLLFMWED